MNTVNLTGRLTKDPDVRYTQADSPMAIARFSLAVEREIKKDGQPTADFISCVAFSKTAEFIEKFFKKGMKVGVMGRIQTGSYTNKDGNKVYTTDILAERVEFEESRGSSEGGSNPMPESEMVNLPEGIDDDIPFI